MTSQAKIMLLVGERKHVENYREKIREQMTNSKLSEGLYYNITNIKGTNGESLIILLEVANNYRYDMTKRFEIFKNISHVILCNDSAFVPRSDTLSWKEWHDKASLVVSQPALFWSLTWSYRDTLQMYFLHSYSKNGNNSPITIHNSKDITILIQYILILDVPSYYKVNPAKLIDQQTDQSTNQSIGQPTDRPVDTNTYDITNKIPPLVFIPVKEIRKRGMIKRLEAIGIIMDANCELFCYRIHWNGIKGNKTRDELTDEIIKNDIRVTDVDDDGFTIRWDKE